MSYKARESSLWNHLLYSECPVKNMTQLPHTKAEPYRDDPIAPVSNNVDTNDSIDSTGDTINEKRSPKFDIEKGDAFVPPSTKRIWIAKVLMALLLVTVYKTTQFFYFYTNGSSVANPHGSIDGKNVFHPFKQLIANDVNTKLGSEIFEVTYPHVARPSFGKSLEQNLLLHHKFGDSWGAPAVVDYKAPKDLSFNKVVLTLDTSVSGVQYDRLAHLFMNGITIWRTSTIEPGGHSTHSNFAKDVSEYLTLFKKDGELSFLLNNLVSQGLDGVFDIKLYVDYYYDEKIAETETEAVAEELSFGSLVSSHRPADKILPLGKALYHLPGDSFKVSLPKLSPSTTKLKLSVFASGNGQEEFWYTNILNKYVPRFPELGLMGHGPVRFVEVSLDGEIIALVAPEPVIFTGGFSPALWSPMVSVSAFDLRAINLDLTGLIPKLSEGNANQLELRVSTGNIDEDKIGNDWILSGNLQVWENDQVVGISGITHDFDHQEKKKVIDLGLAGIEQIITVKRTGSILGELEFKLKQGEPLSGIIDYSVASDISNVQYLPNSTNQELVYKSNVVKATTIKNIDEEGKTSLFKNLHDSIVYPLIINLNLFKDGGLHFKVEIVNGKGVKVETIDEEKHLKPLINLDSYQNGSSMFYLSPAGNHGFGKLRSNYRLTTGPPMPDEIQYRTKVEFVNRSLTIDEVCDNIDDPEVRCEYVR